MTTKAVYEGQRAATSDKRVYILTRSCWAGIQRNAAVVWSGDIRGRWSVYKDQVASGLELLHDRDPLLGDRHRRVFRRRNR